MDHISEKQELQLEAYKRAHEISQLPSPKGKGLRC